MRPSKRKPLVIGSHFSKQNDVTLFHGDCLDMLREIPSGSAKLVITSPPYNIGKKYEKCVSFDSYLVNQRKVIDECVRILRIGGSICWQVGHHVNGHGQIIPLDLALHPFFAEHESLFLRNRIVWHFEHGLHCKQRFSGRHETILWYTKGSRYKFNLDAVRVPQKYPGKRSYKGPKRGEYSCHPGGKNPGDVWIFPNVKANHVEKTKHPCQFPIELPERLILALTKHGDLVVDPYLGVGTAAVAAVLYGRRAAGADLLKAYLVVANRRIVACSSGSVRRRPMGTPVFVPQPNTRLTISPFGRVKKDGVSQSTWRGHSVCRSPEPIRSVDFFLLGLMSPAASISAATLDAIHRSTG